MKTEIQPNEITDADRADFQKRWDAALSSSMEKMTPEERLSLIKSFMHISSENADTDIHPSVRDFFTWLLEPVATPAHALLDRLSGKRKKQEERRAKMSADFDAFMSKYTEEHPVRYVEPKSKETES